MAMIHHYACTLCLLSGAFCLLGQFHPPLYAGEPTLKISLDKQVYLYGEDMFLLIEWTNTTNSVLEAYDLYLDSSTLEIIVRTSRGDTLKYKGIRGGTIKTSVPPGETISAAYDLGSWYGDVDTTHYVFPYLQQGTYLVHAKNWPTEGSEWQRSNELTLIVERPVGDDSLAFNLLNKGRALVIYHDTRALGIEPLETLTRLYPTSPYAPNAYSTLIWAAVKENEVQRARGL